MLDLKEFLEWKKGEIERQVQVIQEHVKLFYDQIKELLSGCTHEGATELKTNKKGMISILFDEMSDTLALSTCDKELTIDDLCTIKVPALQMGFMHRSFVITPELNSKNPLGKKNPVGIQMKMSYEGRPVAVFFKDEKLGDQWLCQKSLNSNPNAIDKKSLESLIMEKLT